MMIMFYIQIKQIQKGGLICQYITAGYQQMLTQNKHGLGVEKVKQFIRDGKLEGEQTEEGFWKVKVYNDECVSKEVFEEEHQKRIEAETTLKNIQNMLKEVIL